MPVPLALAPHPGVPAVRKPSFTAVVAIVLAAAVGYLAFNPEAAEPAVNWLRGLFAGAPDPKGMNYTGYSPVVPGR